MGQPLQGAASRTGCVGDSYTRESGLHGETRGAPEGRQDDARHDLRDDEADDPRGDGVQRHLDAQQGGQQGPGRPQQPADSDLQVECTGTHTAEAQHMGRRRGRAVEGSAWQGIPL